jgi:hypothetical protein
MLLIKPITKFCICLSRFKLTEELNLKKKGTIMSLNINWISHQHQAAYETATVPWFRGLRYRHIPKRLKILTIPLDRRNSRAHFMLHVLIYLLSVGARWQLARRFARSTNHAHGAGNNSCCQTKRWIITVSIALWLWLMSIPPLVSFLSARIKRNAPLVYSTRAA